MGTQDWDITLTGKYLVINISTIFQNIQLFNAKNQHDVLNGHFYNRQHQTCGRGLDFTFHLETCIWNGWQIGQTISLNCKCMHIFHTGVQVLVQD